MQIPMQIPIQKTQQRNTLRQHLQWDTILNTVIQQDTIYSMPAFIAFVAFTVGHNLQWDTIYSKAAAFLFTPLVRRLTLWAGPPPYFHHDSQNSTFLHQYSAPPMTVIMQQHIISKKQSQLSLLQPEFKELCTCIHSLKLRPTSSLDLFGSQVKSC